MTNNYKSWSDEELLEQLDDLDASGDINITDKWELDFLESMISKYMLMSKQINVSPLTEKQRTKVIELLERYL